MRTNWKERASGGVFASVLLALCACGADAEWVPLVERLEADAAARDARVGRLEERGAQLDAEVRRLRGELARRDARVSAPKRAEPPVEAPDVVVPQVEAVASDSPEQDTVATLKGLLGGVLRGTASSEEQQRFWSLLRADGAADELVAAAEEAAHGRPDDVDLRMALADAYLAKLFTVPPGPEMGVWGGKAEMQWKAVLERDPEHWRARYALAESWSHYPEQLNKTPDSIREFEILAEQQESRAVGPEQAAVYVHLSVLYRRQGREADARRVLERGLRRHPDHAELTKALDALGAEETR